MSAFANALRTRYTRAMRFDLPRLALPFLLLVPSLSLACVEEQKQAPQQQPAPPPQEPAQAPVNANKLKGMTMKKGPGLPGAIGVGQGPTASPPPPPPASK